MVFFVEKTIKTAIIRHPRTFGPKGVCKVKIALSAIFEGFAHEARQTPRIRRPGHTRNTVIRRAA
jgi:hypothetical protein